MSDKQLTFFEPDGHASEVMAQPVLWQLYIDGASRSNPGLAGAGIFIVRDAVPFFKKGFFLGHKTNNQAEYLAFLVGVFHLKLNIQKGDLIHIFSDSLLVVKQINGLYKVVNPEIKKLFTIAKQQIAGLQSTIVHIPREENTEADEAANWGIDKRVPLPEPFVSLIPFQL